MEGGNFNQCGFEAVAEQVVNAAAFDEQREMQESLDIAQLECVAGAFEVVGVGEVVAEAPPWTNDQVPGRAGELYAEDTTVKRY